MASKLSAFATNAHALITTGKFSDSLPGVSSTGLDEESLCLTQKNTDKIAIIGSGWLGRALSKRFVEANYDVVIGSRNPSDKLESHFEIVCDFVSIAEACQYADIIILAVPYTAHPSLLQALAINGKDKVVIDCSNRKPDKKYPISVAEELQRNLPNCQIVKAFNDTSAYELNQENNGVMEKTLRYCGDHQAAKEVVGTLMDHIGMNSRDIGALRYDDNCDETNN
jgi:8-hydroxy-5-deazaflavin:NADPH oxidoreductase